MSNKHSNSTSVINTAPAGVTGGYDGHSFTLKALIALFAGLSIYNALEIIALIGLTFSDYCGLYFWSLLVSSLGLVPYAIGFAFKFINILTGDAKWVSIALLDLGWYAIVTGSSVVLWSRLHLIVSGHKGNKILKWTKWMIITDAIVLHVSTTVATFGSNGDIHTARFVQAYNVIEKFQMTGFLYVGLFLDVVEF
jgi:hypothetical protein